MRQLKILLWLLVLTAAQQAWAAEETVTGGTTTMTDATYVVNSNVTITSRITISGTVTLVLTDGYTLTAEKGIELSAGQTLTINGGTANSGRLVINGCSVGDAGIGAVAVGTLVINGGNITVTGGLEAAGIGGSFNNTSSGSITINGGIVTAQGGKFASAIGGGGYDPAQGTHLGLCGTIAINGGQVTALGACPISSDGQRAAPTSPTRCSPSLSNDIDDDRRTDERCDGIEGDDPRFAWKHTEQVAHQCHDSPHEDSGRQQRTVVVGMQHQPCDMWHSQTDEGYGAAEGGDNGGQQSGDDEQQVARTHDVDTQVLGIAVA